ncbi:Transcriptional regulatory protein CitT [Vibrio aerogenes CECT 7868]|uniref:Transcriptional regulatory protein n=1 Tax=Vibrio aerogenes CECT 7868 TaxID=1216006 RepID=A0A1M5Y5D6_9VIBR|nr:response regulator [Vibrio aerogenes]SHI07267.1 Transcriptional regulatory protein CitT [Vibrio aerogenes CECT 7868]
MIELLIADDDQQNAEIQRRFVERVDGFETRGVAHSLDELHDLMDVFQPDLVLLDNHFPTGTGIELLKSWRAQDIRTDIIMITASTEVSTLKSAMACGVFDYILKPLVFERLKRALEGYSAHHDKLQQMTALMQSDVDGLFHPASGSAQTSVSRLPKGIDGLTLDKIRQVLTSWDHQITAEALGQRIGASRTTARRYLEHLVSTGEVHAEVSYGSVGRPERQYLRKLNGA